MKYSTTITVIFLFINLGYSQDYFVRRYDFGTVEDIYQIREYNGRIFINTATFCNTECSFFSEIDTSGNILWRTEVDDIDIAQGTMVIENDTITVTGNNDPFNTAFRMAHFTLGGDKIGETIELRDSTRDFIRMFNLTSQFWNDHYVVCGPAWEGDTAWSLIFVVDKNGTIDTVLTLEPTNADSDLWESYIDNAGLLTTYHDVDWNFSPTNYQRIYKFNSQYDTIWSYKSENSDDNDANPRGCQLLDGRTIISREKYAPWRIQSVRAINNDSTIAWQHDYPFSGSKERQILRLKTANNGDILGSGVYAEKAQLPRIDHSPWLFRMSAEGDLIWERTYYEYDSTIESSRLGAIFDFVELENGDLMAVGYLRYENNDMLIMRVDSNGCLDPGDCPTVNIITDTHDIPLQGNHFVLLYPNPVEDILLIEYESNQYHLEVEVLDITGSIVANAIMTDGRGEVNTAKLPGGVYWLSIKREGKVMSSRKFVKVE
jgi:hypothetical protein